MAKLKDFLTGKVFIESKVKKTRQGQGQHTKFAASSANKKKKRYRGQGKWFQCYPITDEGEVNIVCDGDTSILDVAEEQGVDINYSCRAGAVPLVRVNLLRVLWIKKINHFLMMIKSMLVLFSHVWQNQLLIV